MHLYKCIKYICILYVSFFWKKIDITTFILSFIKNIIYQNEFLVAALDSCIFLRCSEKIIKIYWKKFGSWYYYYSFLPNLWSRNFSLPCKTVVKFNYEKFSYFICLKTRKNREINIFSCLNIVLSQHGTTYFSELSRPFLRDRLSIQINNSCVDCSRVSCWFGNFQNIVIGVTFGIPRFNNTKN